MSSKHVEKNNSPSLLKRRYASLHRVPDTQNDSYNGRLVFSIISYLRRGGARFAALSGWVQVLIIWACTRMWGLLVFQLVAWQQYAKAQAPGDGNQPTLLEYLNWWDAGWYKGIYTEGYPSKLILNHHTGVVVRNTWAFFPAHPKLAGIIARASGLSYEMSSVILSTGISFGLALVLYKIFLGSLNWRDRSFFDTRERPEDEPRRSMAVWAVAIYGFCGPAVIFNTAYAESLTIFAIALTALLLIKERYLWALPAAFLASQSRPVGVPLGALAGLWWLYCLCAEYRMRRRGDESIPPQGASKAFLGAFAARLLQLASALVVCAFAFGHVLHAAYKTGRPDAYLATELGWSGRTVAQGNHYITQWGTELQLRLPTFSEYAVLALVLIGFAVYYGWIFARSTRRVLHPVLVLWCAAYAGYLLVFWLPHTSTFRILLPLFPLALLLTNYGGKSKAFRWLMVIAGINLQLVWTGWLWHSYGPTDLVLP